MTPLNLTSESIGVQPRFSSPPILHPTSPFLDIAYRVPLGAETHATGRGGAYRTSLRHSQKLALSKNNGLEPVPSPHYGGP